MNNKTWINIGRYVNEKLFHHDLSSEQLLNQLNPMEEKIHFGTHKNSIHKTIYAYIDKFIDREYPKFYFSLNEVSQLHDVYESNGIHWKNDLINTANTICHHRLRILGLGYIQYDNPIDWHRDPLTYSRYPISSLDFVRKAFRIKPTYLDPKFRAEVNRMQYLSLLAKAYLVTKDETYARKTKEIMCDWIFSNPPTNGIYFRSALEVALRIITWFWCIEFCKKSKNWDKEFLINVFKSLYMQSTYIFNHLQQREYPNNHLIGEAVSLAIAGVYLPEFKDAIKWKTRGMEILQQQIDKQTDIDGYSKEQSTHYHRFVLDLYTLMLILYQKNNIIVDNKMVSRLEKMYDALLYLSQPDGSIPLLGDEDSGRAIRLVEESSNSIASVLSTGAVLFNRSDMKFVAAKFHEESFWLLGLEGYEQFKKLESHCPESKSIRFRESDLCVTKLFTDADQGDNAANSYFVFKSGSQGMGNGGHSHADALSFILSCYGVPLVIDPGTYVYNAQEKWRNYFRGTSAHNTIRIDDKDQAVPISFEESFGWKEKYKSNISRMYNTSRILYCEGQHTGYKRLEDPVIHSRSILSINPLGTTPHEENYWIITDFLKGNDVHDIDLFLHLAHCEIEFTDSHQIIALYPNGVRLLIYICQEKQLTIGNSEISIHNNHPGPELSVINGWQSADYGKRESSPVVQFRVNGCLFPNVIHTIILPIHQSNYSELAVHCTKINYAQGFELHMSDSKHIYLYRNNEQSIKFKKDLIESDGEITYIKLNKLFQLDHGFIINGSYLRIGTETPVEIHEKIGFLEILRTGSQYELYKK